MSDHYLNLRHDSQASTLIPSHTVAHFNVPSNEHSYEESNLRRKTNYVSKPAKKRHGTVKPIKIPSMVFFGEKDH
jgi:hypothetical protein